uniref:Carboxylesterase type B domain-containing protein n=1 Tax=Acrobeloides nanus TaxID=290746 RepID=A0A914CXD0_9BILA
MNEMRMAEIMTTYVTNFAKYGNPNGIKNNDDGYWEPLSIGNTTKFLKINLPKPVMQDNLHQGRVKAWQQILKEDKLYN